MDGLVKTAPKNDIIPTNCNHVTIDKINIYKVAIKKVQPYKILCSKINQHVHILIYQEENSHATSLIFSAYLNNRSMYITKKKNLCIGLSAKKKLLFSLIYSNDKNVSFCHF